MHYFGNESSESILQEYGILPKDNQEVDVLKPKQCSNCNEPNRPDQKFCIKCRMVLSIEAFQDTLEEQQRMDAVLQSIKEQMAQYRKEVQMLMSNPKQLQKLLAEVSDRTKD